MTQRGGGLGGAVLIFGVALVPACCCGAYAVKGIFEGSKGSWSVLVAALAAFAIVYWLASRGSRRQ